MYFAVFTREDEKYSQSILFLLCEQRNTDNKDVANGSPKLDFLKWEEYKEGKNYATVLKEVLLMKE